MQMLQLLLGPYRPEWHVLPPFTRVWYGSACYGSELQPSISGSVALPQLGPALVSQASVAIEDQADGIWDHVGMQRTTLPLSPYQSE